MRHQTFAVLAVSVTLGAGCGNQPTAPSSPAGPNATAAVAAVDSVIAQTLTEVAIAPPGLGTLTSPITRACPGGGSMMLFFDPPTFTPPPATTMSTKSRMEYRDCNSGGTILNGDPYVQMTGDHAIGSVAGGTPTNSSSTLRMTGGLRFSLNGVQGRAHFDCTSVMSITFVGGAAQVSRQSSGTITWEQPLGNPTTRPCA